MGFESRLLALSSTLARRGFRPTLTYVVIGATWIITSDVLLRWTVSDPGLLTRIQTMKGWVFVVLSAAVIHALVLREVRATRESERRLRILVEQSLAGVCVIQDGRFAYVNPKLAEILGVSVTVLTRLGGAEQAFEEGSRGRFLERLARAERALPDGEVPAPDRRPCVLNARHAAGQNTAVEIAMESIEWRSRPAVVGLILDRSEQEALEEQLRHAQRMEALGQLTGAIAHDFNNLLTAVGLPLEAALMEIGDEHTVSADLAAALRATRSASLLTRQLLTFSRKRASRPVVLGINVALCEIREMVERLSGEAVTVRLDLIEHEREVLIDPSHLEQVMMNLVVNAIGAMPEGGTITIRTRDVPADRRILRHRDSLRPGPHVVVEVEDTGVGMDKATQLRVFEPFFTTKEGGTGLGLSTVFGIVRQAEGFVRIESEAGKGTRMQVFLPICEEQRAESETLVAMAGASPTVPELESEPRTILVVEDDDLVRRQLERVLASAGFRVLGARDGLDALRLAEDYRGQIHLLFTDLMLPGMSGFALSAEFRKSHPGTSVLYSSGYSEPGIIRQLRAEPEIPFLEKPVQVRELIEAVESALRHGARLGVGRGVEDTGSEAAG